MIYFFMAGHSHISNIIHKKNAHNQNISKIFTNIARLIRSAIKEHGNIIEANPKLKSALERAKNAGFPKEKINKIFKAQESVEKLERIVYEAYGPGNNPLIIESMTNNKNRTAAQVRRILTEYHGKLQGCEYLFQRSALVAIDNLTEDELLQFIEYGAEEVINAESEVQILFQIDGFTEIANQLPCQDKIIFSGLGWIKKYPIILSENDKEQLELLRYELLNCEDITEVWI